MWQFLMRLWSEECGTDQVEYALLVAFIALALAIAIHTLGFQLTDLFRDAEAKLRHLEYGRARRH